MIDTDEGERDRLVVLTKYPDAFCTRQSGGPWRVIRTNPYAALSGEHGNADEAWADAASYVRFKELSEQLQGAVG